MRDPRRYVLLLLVAMLATNQMDRTVLAILLDDIGREFSLSDTQLGLISGGLFVIVYAVFGFPVAKLAAHANRRNIIAASMVVWSALTLLVAAAQNFAQLAIARLGVSIGESGSVVPAHSMISDLYPANRRTSAMASFVVGANIGVLLAFLVGGIAGEFLGWRWAFVIAGLPGICLALIMLTTVKEPAREAGADASTRGLFARTLSAILADRGLRNALIGLSLTSILTHAGLAWNAAFIMRAHGLGMAQTGILLAGGAGILGSFVTFTSGRMADRFGARNPRFRLGIVVVAILVGKPFSAAFALLEPTWAALLCLLVPVGLASVFWGPTFAFVHGRVSPQMRPMATAIFMFAFSVIGVGLGPTLIGLLSDTMFAAAGDRSLGWSIVAIQTIGVWGAFHYLVAMKTIPRAMQAAA
ncbi:MAG TPA: MFS transporter [Devosiaceae bacterium]